MEVVSLEEVPDRAIIVLLPKQVHLQKEVAAVAGLLASVCESRCELSVHAANVRDRRESNAKKIGNKCFMRAILANNAELTSSFYVGVVRRQRELMEEEVR